VHGGLRNCGGAASVVLVEARHSGKPFFVLPYRKFWKGVSAHYGNLMSYSMVFFTIRLSLLIPVDTSCNERGIAEYTRIYTASLPILEVSKVRGLFVIKHYGPKSVNSMPRICMRDICALSPRATVLRRVPNDETWRHFCERS
jgi:hypothetical protein